MQSYCYWNKKPSLIVKDASSIKKRKIGFKNGVEGVSFLNSAGSGFQRKGFR